MSELTSIVSKPTDAASNPDGYARVPLAEAQLVAGYGIQGDAKGGRPQRNLNIMSTETLMSLAGEGFQTGPGALGEQLVIAGLIVDALPSGARLRIGAKACVELVQPRTGCVVFEKHQAKARQLAAGRLGMMATVVAGGAIRVGDSVTMVTECCT